MKLLRGHYNVSVSVRVLICIAHRRKTPSVMGGSVHVNKNVFSRRLKAVSVEFGLRTGSIRLFQADGPAMAKSWRPYVLSRWRGTWYRGFGEGMIEETNLQAFSKNSQWRRWCDVLQQSVKQLGSSDRKNSIEMIERRVRRMTGDDDKADQQFCSIFRCHYCRCKCCCVISSPKFTKKHTTG